MLLEENLRRVEQNIEAAAERGEHAAEAVTLLAVSKTKPASAIRELTEVNEAVDEMIDSLFVVLDRINNAQVFLANMHNLVDGMLSLLEEEYDLPQLTEE